MAIAEDYMTDDEPVSGEAMPEEQSRDMVAAQWLQMAVGVPNLLEVMPPEVVDGLALKVLDEVKIDEESRSEWMKIHKDSLDAAMMIAGEKKDYPFPGAANVKFPLLTSAVLQFNARAYPAMVPGGEVVKAKVFGSDPQGRKAGRGKRVAAFVSWQLLQEMPEWEEDTDALCIILPACGSVFRKTWFDPTRGRARSKLVTADRLIVNYWTRSLEDCPRITEELYLYPHQYAQRVRAGEYIEHDLGDAGAQDTRDEGDQVNGDPSAEHKFYEQHRLIDVDGDGMPEPYIVTVHAASQTVCRIVANWDAQDVVISPETGRVLSVPRAAAFTHYRFLPSVDGSFYGLGLGWLLHSLTKTIDTTLNQLLDAGHYQNLGGGWIGRELRIKGGNARFRPGEWKMVPNAGNDVRSAVVPMQWPGASPVLFQLLGSLIEAAREVASIKDVMTGTQNSTAPATTTLAMIEQGMQVFSAIYKRMHRAMKGEIKILCRLNRDTVNPNQYAMFHDVEDPEAGPPDPRADFEARDMDIVPVTDPQMVSRQMEMARAQLLLELSQTGGLNAREAMKRILDIAQVENVDALLPPEQAAEEQQAAAMMQQKAAALAEVAAMAELANKRADTVKKLADAEAAEKGPQLAAMKMIADQMEMANGRGTDGGSAGGMAGAPGNGGGVPNLAAAFGQDQGGMAGGGMGGPA